ncbi:hypothetical protein HPP92_006955 [Vanilla planifolia]|uniref:Uncharacterized protein n=1 Tax=Vanilla planifolia TaxID=51239 RepID=A0A835RFR0_VANPL|nr:hypothetical protein HPP92_006955 [Vanilla planifolia]
MVTIFGQLDHATEANHQKSIAKPMLRFKLPVWAPHMDLTPPSPLSPTLPSPPTVVAAADDLSASEIWDWGNLLDFAIEADDSLILPLESLDVAQLPSSMPLASEVESPAEPPAAVGRSSRVRKRDPRLVCANYLAGRVPCSCPEVDEKALGG